MTIMLSRKRKHKKLGQTLVEAGLISSDELVRLLERQQAKGGYLGRLLVESGHIDERELDRYLPKEIVRRRTQASLERSALDHSEFYRLQTALKFTLFSDEPIRTLMMTSALPGEGKTVCADYFARIVATVREGRFLVIDADLRHPNIHNKFDVPLHPGWTDYLVNGNSAEDCLFKTDVPNLYVMPAGTVPPNPSALFASNKMKEFISELRDSFDLVVFDSSPLLPMSDAVILGSNLDAATMVIKAGSTRRQLVKKAINKLGDSNTKILGVILNQMVDHDLPGYVYKYSGGQNGNK